jgi:hypothetical protein
MLCFTDAKARGYMLQVREACMLLKVEQTINGTMALPDDIRLKICF